MRADFRLWWEWVASRGSGERVVHLPVALGLRIPPRPRDPHPRALRLRLRPRPGHHRHHHRDRALRGQVVHRGRVRRRPPGLRHRAGPQPHRRAGPPHRALVFESIRRPTLDKEQDGPPGGCLASRWRGAESRHGSSGVAARATGSSGDLMARAVCGLHDGLVGTRRQCRKFSSYLLCERCS